MVPYIAVLPHSESSKLIVLHNDLRVSLIELIIKAQVHFAHTTVHLHIGKRSCADYYHNQTTRIAKGTCTKINVMYGFIVVWTSSCACAYHVHVAGNSLCYS